MLRVPGSRGDLLRLRSQRRRRARRLLAARRGGRSPRENPRTRVVFFGIGFETTAPANAMAVFAGAASRACANFSMLVSHVLVPPAIAAILQAPGNRVQGFLGPGHVCAVMGYREYEALADALPRADRRHRLRAGRPARGRAGWPCSSSRRAARRSRTSTRARVAREGNRPARDADRRGVRGARSQVARRRRHPQVGLPASLRVPGARRRAALRRREIETRESAACISGLVLRGLKKPSRLPGLRHDLHAADAARRDDGLGRGRLRRLLPVRPVPARDRREGRHPAQGARERRASKLARSSRSTPPIARDLRARAGRALPGRRAALRHGQRRLGLRRAARGGRVPAPDHREAPRAARHGARRPNGAAHRDRQRHRLLPASSPISSSCWRGRATPCSASPPPGASANVNRALQARARAGAARPSASPAATAGDCPTSCDHCFVVPALVDPPHPGDAHRCCCTCSGTRCTSRWEKTMSSDDDPVRRLPGADRRQRADPARRTAAAASSPPS